MDDPRQSPIDLLDFGDEHEDEQWLVSYADMVTLLFGFFVILYSFSNLDEKKLAQVAAEMTASFEGSAETHPETETQRDLEQQLKAFKVLVKTLGIADSTEAATRKIEAMQDGKQSARSASKILQELARTQKNEVRELVQNTAPQEQLTELILPDLSLFKAGSADLLPSAETKIQALARDLRVLRDIAEIEVVGHTDNAPPGKNALFRDNFTLSSLRAGTVAQRLIQYGISPSLLAVKGMGGLRPIAPERDEQGRWIKENMAKNRRVHIVLRRRASSDGR